MILQLRNAFHLAALAFFPLACGAAPYQPLGAPVDPQVSAQWNFYRSYDEATGLLKQLAAAHPEVCRLQSVGKSHQGRELWVLTITDQAGAPETEAERPAFWIDGGIHANEVQAVDVVLYTAWFLCESRGRNAMVDRLLSERVFYLMPMMSPDSRAAHMENPNTTHSPRSGQAPIDNDRDGLVNEDPADDLDGDGHITQMRVADPNGRWKPDPDFPQLMVRAKPDEAGSYRMLDAEGIDNDGDGLVNEDGDGHYDPNRDWAWQWQPDYVQRGAHRYPFSLPENRAVADFIAAHPHIGGAQSYHNTGGMILRGPGSKSDRWPGEDIAVYDRLAEKGTQMLPGYRYINTAEELYEVWGGETDWLYGMQGIFAFTNELNTPFNMFREKPAAGNWFGSPTDQHRFDKLLLLGDGFVPWHEVDHPQYGKIEVGGQKKTWGRQPPSFLLEEECHRNMAFTLFHADEMALVQVDALSVEPLPGGLLAGGLRQVTATIVNNKLTPTRSRHDLANKITPDDRAELRGQGLTVITAMTSDSPYFEDAASVRRDPANVRIDRVGSRQPVYVRWLVEGEGEITVTVRSTKGGVATAESDGATDAS
ncbi:Carboxypeptidase T precursor [Pirellulimonas nuda]|uniref:Carboxypeptidase T n=1 Tax=Pirellulimonas nuda TaxID=2528009 RepID=A0A518DJ58_9BACT|nr:M14 family metallopeptidase [Pirellulimonas nuda]QDU91486.1 Carboxypeptidase T precursor [Pirellulimonas nuda]